MMIPMKEFPVILLWMDRAGSPRLGLDAHMRLPVPACLLYLSFEKKKKESARQS
jgi:hypothetical protein